MHALSFSIVSLIALSSIFLIPDLWKKPETIFASVGGFATFYGVIFAIIEVWRARSASDNAEIAAKSASERINSIFDIKNISECQSGIRATLTDLEKDGWASTSALSRIIELYTGQFHVAYNAIESPHRDLIVALQSHAASASGPLTGRALKRLKATLVNMLANLTAVASAKISEKTS